IASGRIVLAGAVLFLAVAPSFLEAGGLTVLTEFFCLLVLALMWNLLAGYADIVTVGQHAFLGVGAYAFYGMSGLLDVAPFPAFATAALTALAVAVPAMLIVFRLRAAYLAVGTWVVAEVLMLIAGKLPNFGFGSGVSLPVHVVREFGARPDARFATIYWL